MELMPEGTVNVLPELVISDVLLKLDEGLAH